MRIQHNIVAINTCRNYNTNTSALSKNLEKLSSGYKINRAGDDSANFNGIKLLDGSLAKEQTATKIELGGNITGTKSAATKGKFDQFTAIGAVQDTDMKAGDYISYTVALNDGTSETVKFTWAADENGDIKNLVNDKGEVVHTAAGADTITAAAQGDLIKAALEKTSIGEKFDVTHTAGKLSFTTKEAGSTDTVKALGWEYKDFIG